MFVLNFSHNVCSSRTPDPHKERQKTNLPPDKLVFRIIFALIFHLFLSLILFVVVFRCEKKIRWAKITPFAARCIRFEMEQKCKMYATTKMFSSGISTRANVNEWTFYIPKYKSCASLFHALRGIVIQKYRRLYSYLKALSFVGKMNLLLLLPFFSHSFFHCLALSLSPALLPASKFWWALWSVDKVAKFNSLCADFPFVYTGTRAPNTVRH